MSRYFYVNESKIFFCFKLLKFEGLLLKYNVVYVERYTKVQKIFTVFKLESQVFILDFLYFMVFFVCGCFLIVGYNLFGGYEISVLGYKQIFIYEVI